MCWLKKRLKIYWPFAKGNMQKMMSYRINFFIFVLGGLIRTFVIYYLWKAVFQNSSAPTLNGFSLPDMIVYIFISSVTAGVISCDTDFAIAGEVKDGSVAMNLIRPINYKVRMFFETLGTFLYQFIFIAIPIWVILVITRYTSSGELPPDIGTLAVYLLSMLLGFVTLFLINFCFGLLAFFVTGIWGMSHLKGAIISFFSGELIPIAFFPLWLQGTLNFFPFSSLSYIPVMIYLKKFTGLVLIQTLGVQFAWVAGLLIISSVLWNRAAKRLTIFGG
ncbi:MAG: ABC-2 family transporter protein [Clostridiaceae bacterium]